MEKSDNEEESAKSGSDAEDDFENVFDIPNGGEESSPATTPPITLAPAPRRRPKPAYTGGESSLDATGSGITAGDPTQGFSDDEQ